MPTGLGLKQMHWLGVNPVRVVGKIKEKRNNTSCRTTKLFYLTKTVI